MAGAGRAAFFKATDPRATPDDGSHDVRLHRPAAPGPHHDRADPRPGLAGRRRHGGAGSIEAALALAEGDVYVAGGAAVYEAALPYADEQLLSEIDLEPEGDTYYPDFDRAAWPEVSREHREGFDVVRLERAMPVAPGDLAWVA